MSQRFASWGAIFTVLSITLTASAPLSWGGYADASKTTPEATSGKTILYKDTDVVSYSGDGLMVTRPFTVEGPWGVQFQSTDALFIYLMQNGEAIDLVANQTKGGSSSYYSPDTGTFYLKIVGLGNWKVKIIRVYR